MAVKPHPTKARAPILRRAAECAAVALVLGSTLALQAQVPGEYRRWSLSPVPIVRIGTGDSDAETFDRIIGAARMPGGEIVIADGASQELRVFSPTGAHLRTISRRGEGPGEFRNLGSFSASGDSLFVIERPPGPSRLYLFTVGDGFIRHEHLRGTAPGGVTGIARLENGAVLVTRGGFRAVTPPPVGTLARDSMTLGILHVDRSVMWLGTFPGNTWLGYALPPGSGAVSHSLTRFPYGGSILYAGGGDRVWIGDSESGRIQIFAADGTRVGSIGAPMERRPLSREALERSRRLAREGSDPVTAARIDAVHDRARRVGTVPYFSRFTAGPDGELWIESFRESDSEPAVVIVLDRTGKPIGSFAIPAGATVLEGGLGHVLLLQRDGDGVQSVALFALRR